MVKIESKPLDINEISALVEDPSAGAVDIFVGRVRNNTGGKPVVRLEFEAYEKMALKEMEKIISEAKKKWPILKAAIFHRVGVLHIGEIAVLIAVATPHRAVAFAACEYMIDTLKETVPIWKKEIFEDGEVWVSAHP